MKKHQNEPKNRVVIPVIGVNAPLVQKQVAFDGIMPEPNTPDEIVYHDLSLWPDLGGILGKKGNAIFTGHVDSGAQYCDYGKTPPPCRAVLWDLDKLKKEDKIVIYYNNHVYHYKVLLNKQQVINGNTWIKNLKRESMETITVITCAGEFDVSTLEYKSQQIVKAIRVNNK